MKLGNIWRRAAPFALALAAAITLAAPAMAQAGGSSPPSAGGQVPASEPQVLAPLPGGPGDVAAPAASGGDASAAQASPNAAATGTAPAGTTYRKDDLLGAAEGVFGKGAKGLAGIIEDLLRKQGEPNGYIVGREGSAALVVGLRYGSGTLHHKIEGEQPVYWTGPSIGFDAGANAAKAFVLVYNLHDTADLYKRFGAGEGQAYFIAGFHVGYMRRGDVVLIPVRTGAGLRLGVNAGYMKFSRTQKWLPF